VRENPGKAFAQRQAIRPVKTFRLLSGQALADRQAVQAWSEGLKEKSKIFSLAIILIIINVRYSVLPLFM